MVAASLLRTFVFGIDPRSGVLLLAVSVGVLALATLASMPSVVRAMKLDPRATTKG